MKPFFKHQYADKHPDIYPLPILSHFAREQMPELIEEALNDKKYGANNFAKGLVSAVNQSNLFNESKKTITFSEKLHAQIAAEDLKMINAGIQRIVGKKFSMMRMLMNGMLSVKFGQKDIYYEKRDLTNPMIRFIQYINEFEKNGQQLALKQVSTEQPAIKESPVFA